MQVDLQIHPKFAPLYPPNNKYRYYVYHGGRCGLKSWAFAQAAIMRGTSEKLNILCCREIQKSIRESVHALLSDTIARLGLMDQWEIQNDRILCRTTGSKINFIGLHNNTHNLKSYEGTDICWVEEAQAVTDKSWDDLDPTIRKDGAEIWISFNPEDELDPTYVRFCVNRRKNSIVVKTSWRDAEEYGWFPKDLKEQMLQMRDENYKKYLHVWEGEPNSNYEDAIIQPEWVEASVDAHIKLNWDVCGAKIASFDPSDSEMGDPRAWAMRHGFLLKDLKQWINRDIAESIPYAYRMSYDLDCEQMVYDGDGLGAAMKIGLDKNEAEYKLKAIPFHGGMKPDEPDAPYPPYNPNKPPPERVKLNKDTFRNKRAQYYWFLRDRLENTYNAITKNIWVDPEKCISISSEIDPEDYKQLRRELTRVRLKKGANSSMKTLESKKDMKAAGMKSPNLADAVMMLFANQDVFGAMPDFDISTDWD